MLQFFIYAGHYTFLVFIPQMHGASVTISVIMTLKALPCFCPVPVTHDFKFLIPHISKLIPVNVSLHKMTVNIGASRDGTIN
jgi:hypothetical protein